MGDFFLTVSPLYGSALPWGRRVTAGKPLGDFYSLEVLRITPVLPSLWLETSHMTIPNRKGYWIMQAIFVHTWRMT